MSDKPKEDTPVDETEDMSAADTAQVEQEEVDLAEEGDLSEPAAAAYEYEEEGDETVPSSEAEPVKEPAEEKEPAAPASEPVVDVGFDSELLGVASQLGIPEAAARAFGSPEALESHLNAVLGRMPATPGEEKGDPATDAFGVKLDREEVAPELVDEFGRFAEHYNGRSDALAGRLEQLEQQLQVAATTDQRHKKMEFYGKLDAAVTDFGEEYVEYFGKQPSVELAFDSPQMKLRRDLAGTVTRLDDGTIPLATLIQRARDAVLGDKAQAIAAKRFNAAASKRRNHATSRPQARRASPEPGDDAAIAHANKYLAEHGAGAEADAEDEGDF